MNRKTQETPEQKFNFLFKDMQKRKYMPYISANRSIIKGFFPDIKRKYPEATVFYAGQIEYTCLTDEARQMLVLSLSKRVEDMQRDIKAYKKILNEAQ